jgi:dienelactone hydrolase
MNLQNSNRCLLFFVLLLSAEPLIGQTPAAPPAKPRLKDEMRLPWVRNNEWYFRHWLVVGGFEAPAVSGADSAETAHSAMSIDFLKEHGGEPGIHPTPNLEHHRPDGTTVRWHRGDSFHDYVGLEDQSSTGMHGSGVAYAFAAFPRREAGKVLLSIGTDGGFRVWVNGKPVLEKLIHRQLTLDEDQIDVPVVAGENTVLIKLELKSGPGNMYFRILETGAVLGRQAEIGPTIIEDKPGAGVLTVRTDLAGASPDAAPVKVEVVGAGGKVFAQKQELRGRQVSFETGSWPEGAYEIRFSTSTLSHRPFAAHLPWYKGDPIKAARNLLADAAKADPRQPIGMTLQLLADMVRDRLGEKLDAIPGNPWSAIHSPLMEYEELKQLEHGGPGPVRPYGFVRLAYLDGVDGSPQFCRAYLPAGYTAAKKWPLVVNLHGYHQTNPEYFRWYWVDRRHVAFNSEFADNHPVIVLEPHGRGNTSYLGLGEKDILRVIRMAEERFSVDDDRVYLMGESMGGYGVWNIGTRHPDIFAAIAPIYGGSDYHVQLAEEELARLSPTERFLQEKGSSFCRAEALLNLAIFIHHGDADPAVNVDYSRYVVRMLQRWGYDIRYREHPGGQHEDLKVANEIVDWFLEHKRDSRPHHVRIRSAELKSASAYWARIEQFGDPLAFMLLDAEVVGPNLIRLDTENVEALTLSPRPPLVDPLKPVKVVWNGEPARILSLEGGKITLRKAGRSPAALHKSPESAGPIIDLMSTPFAVVAGTVSTDDEMRNRCRQKADEFVSFWQRWQHYKPRFFLDKDLSDRDAEAYSLLLIGGPSDNLITQRIADRLPLKIAADSIQLGAKSYPATDAAVQMLYPNPLNPARYVSVVAGTSADGMFFWDPNDRNVWDWDFVIVDGKSLSARTQFPEQGRVVSGLWGAEWGIEGSGLVEGDAEMRAKATAVKVPHLNRNVDPSVFKAYVGSYEIAPGFQVKVDLEGNHLMLHVPGQLDGEMFPESDTEFFMNTGGLRMSFVRDSSGKVTTLVIHTPGRDYPAKAMSVRE